jgi:MFS family permease
MDLSEGSGAIQTEIDMIERAARWPDTIILVTAAKSEDEEPELIERLAEKGATIIKYTKSWWKAIPRLLLGLLAAGLFSTPLFLMPFLIALLVSGLIGSLSGSGAGIAAMNFTPWGPALQPALQYILVLFALGWIWLFYVFFVHPAFSKKAKKALKNRLRDSLALAEPQQAIGGTV